MHVKMLRYIESFVQVRDLKPGDVVELTDAVGQQFIENGMAVRVEAADRTERLEAAALSAARRRG